MGTKIRNSIGVAYIFNRNGSGWVQQAKLMASNGAINNGFGFSVSIDGDYAVVGTPSSGAAYVFLRGGSIGRSWIQQAKLTDNVDDDFGYSVAINGNYIVVGARDYDAGIGTAYVFRRSEANILTGRIDWSQQVMLTAADGEELGDNAFFGGSVAIDGSYILVGAEAADATSVLERTGAAYVYQVRR